MIRVPGGDREEGQVIPALLLVVVALLFFSLLFIQVGSASEQKTQTQTAADSAAVAAAHSMRDSGLVQAAIEMPWTYKALFAIGGGVPDPLIQASACDAAQRNWSSNPHHGDGLDCGQLNAYPVAGGVRVELIAPSGQVVNGPAQVQNSKAQAAATADVVDDHCSDLAGPPVRKAAADYLIDTMLTDLGSSSTCLTPPELTELNKLNTYPYILTAAVQLGPTNLIYDSARNSVRTQLTDD